MPAQNILIIGSGIAGLSAAQAAREAAPGCRVTILSDDSHAPYYRQRLCEVLEDEGKAGALSLHPQPWYAEQGFDLRLKQEVQSLDTARKLYVGDKLTGLILLGDTKAFSSLNRQLEH